MSKHFKASEGHNRSAVWKIKPFKLARALRQGDFGLAGWVYGRRVRYRDHIRADDLEKWFKKNYPRVSPQHRPVALYRWRAGFIRGFTE